MPDWIKFPLVLTVVACISAASLAGLYKLTEPVKAALASKETKTALKDILPNTSEFEEKSDGANSEEPAYFIAKDEKGNVIGYAAQGISNGYAGPVKVMVGVDTEFKIIGTKVLEQSETPGLGDKIIEKRSKKTWGTVVRGENPDESGLKPYFQEQFEGKTVPVKLKRDGGEIEAITGATISSKAFIQAVNSAVESLKKSTSYSR